MRFNIILTHFSFQVRMFSWFGERFGGRLSALSFNPQTFFNWLNIFA